MEVTTAEGFAVEVASISEVTQLEELLESELFLVGGGQGDITLG